MLIELINSAAIKHILLNNYKEKKYKKQNNKYIQPKLFYHKKKKKKKRTILIIKIKQFQQDYSLQLAVILPTRLCNRYKFY